MQIELFINNEKKNFTVPFIKARMFRRVLELRKKEDFNNLSEETLDKMVDLAVETFNNQFSRDEFYDGIAADKLVPTLMNIMNTIAGSKTGKSEVQEIASGDLGN